MNAELNTIEKMASLVYTLRHKCALKDNYFVQTLNISFAEYNCLTQYFEKDRLTVKEISERLDITPGGVTRIITSLEEKGLVERHISKEDRRGIDVILTESGSTMVNQIRDASHEMHAEILKHIDVEHHESVLKAVEHLIKALDHWIGEHQAKPQN